MHPKSPLAQTLASALQGSETLGGLMQRVRESKAKLAAIAPLMPAALSAGVRAGPLDETGWTLLVDNAASAAKLRQWLPALEASLKSQGWASPVIRIKVLPRG